jgi:murein DD-endopeptidase MepM/ murein hydrolase activator NlpD
MFLKIITSLLLLGWFSATISAQNNTIYPKGDFINPMDIPLNLAGNFGELRGNHFHSGFDFRTNAEEGYLIKAVADGYVSRIKVSAFGYGNALYITHNNGYVSVYGHLQRYDSTISNYVIKKQYELESFEVDLFPQKNEILVNQGQLIALSGNTGGSEGPHLHFEIRDQKTEEIINPYYFGFDIEDTIPPSIEGIAIYPIDQHSKVNGSNTPKYFEVKKLGSNNYTLKEDITLSGKIGFGLITYDVENGSANKNGTYAYELKKDSAILFKYACNRFSFDQTRYINAHLDYGKMKKNKERYQRCFVLPGNNLKHYETDEHKGVYEFNDTLVHNVIIKAFDFKKNTSTFEMKCKSAISTSTIKSPNLKDLLLYNKANQFNKEDIAVDIPLHCLYQDVVFKYAKTAGNSKLLSDVHHILNEETPVHSAYILRIKPKALALKQKDKLLVVSIDDEGNPSSEGGEYENGFVVAKLRNFGNFAVMMDTTAPSIKLLNYDKEKSVFKQNKIDLKISDNLSGIKNYKGTIDGVWVLLQHDNKEKTLTYNFDEKLLKSEEEHIFEVTIIDKKGNSKKLTTKFNY